MPRGARVTKGPKKHDHKPSRRQEYFQATSDQARQAQRRAQEIFLSMIENPVAPHIFVAKARYINPDVYNDVVVERAVAGLCGYPMCPNTFTDTYGTQAYVIRSNRLYDIAERRNFCSNVCYEASDLVRKQVLKLPLYLRDTQDSDIKDIILPNLAQLRGRHGKLVDVTGGMTVDEDEDLEKPRVRAPFWSSGDIARDSLVNWSENEHDLKKDQRGDTEGEKIDQDKDRTANDDAVIDDSEQKSDDLWQDSGIQKESDLRKKQSETRKTNDKKKLKKEDSGHFMTDDKILIGKGDHTYDTGREKDKSGRGKRIKKQSEAQWKTDEKNKLNKKDSRHGVVDGKKLEDEEDWKFSYDTDKQKDKSREEKKTEKIEENPLFDIYEVEGALREWMSFDSLRMVLGDMYVKGMLEHLGHNWESYNTTAGLRLSVEAKARYVAICRRLEHEERLEEGEVKDTSEQHHGGHSQARNPLPDYSQLQLQAKKQQLKVVSFLGGSDQYEEPEEGRLDTIAEEEGEETPVVKRKTKPKKCAQDEDTDGPTLPFIDSYAQAAWRQNIVEDKVNIYLQQLLVMTTLSVREVRQLLTTLVATFHLSPNNISFLPKQWRIITLILLKMLSVRYPVIHEALLSEEGLSIQKNILSAFNLDLGYCDRILSYLTEIKHILSKDFKDGETAGVNSKDNTETAKEKYTSTQDRTLAKDLSDLNITKQTLD